MASLTASPIVNSLALLCLLCSLWSGFASKGEETEKCDPSSFLSFKGNEKVTYLSLVHKNGPCALFFQEGEGKNASDSEAEIRGQDEKRERLIQSRLKDIEFDFDGTTDSNYLVKVNLGGQELRLAFDTGSTLTWTQCNCNKANSYCYYQDDEPFNMDKSKFNRYPCSDGGKSICEDTTGVKMSCSIDENCNDRMRGRGHDDHFVKERKGECRYSIQYGDNSFTSGVLGLAPLTFGKYKSENFLFGCANENQGRYSHNEDGILGLGYDEKFSIVKQINDGKIFSYCIPPDPEKVGFLRFGHESHPKETQKEDMIIDDTHYKLTLKRVEVGGVPLPGQYNVIVDSGTTYTILPTKLYEEVKGEYNIAMEKSGYSIANDCLKPDELKGFPVCHEKKPGEKFKIPDIIFIFRSNRLELPKSGITVQWKSESDGVEYACLAFKEGKGQEVIWGSYQQKGIEINIDAGENKVWFDKADDCKPKSPGGNSVSF